MRRLNADYGCSEFIASLLIEYPEILLVLALDMPQFHQTEAAEGIVHRSAGHSRVAVFCAASEPKPIRVGQNMAIPYRLVTSDHVADELDYIKASLDFCSLQHDLTQAKYVHPDGPDICTALDDSDFFDKKLSI
jgi:hypothetical protein